MEIDSTSSAKDILRKEILVKRDLLSPEAVKQKSRAIFEKLIERDEYINSDNILVYASMKSEVITDEIILDALSLGKKVFCPKVTDTRRGQMKFVRIYDTAELEAGYYGIREPLISEDSEIYECCEKTLVIVPGVAFDKNGNRIGYKGGFYDRFLSDNPGVFTIALAYNFQIMDEIPSEIHDIPVKDVICE